MAPWPGGAIERLHYAFALGSRLRDFIIDVFKVEPGADSQEGLGRCIDPFVRQDHADTQTASAFAKADAAS
jgi:hypothetical protein